ncbi:MAG: IS4 family transposase, partial [Candidatus Accumulibacter sp.]|nr:IS4 family transposase [Accumulibacter sp.]
MNVIKKVGMTEQVRRFRARFVQGGGTLLGSVLTGRLLQEVVYEETGRWRERIYGPLTTLVLFLEQVLGGDRSCHDAVARGLSLRVSQGQAPCGLNTGAYCQARARLSAGLVERLGRVVAARLCAAQPKQWLWHGREVKLVDGTTVSMPDTKANQGAFPQNHEQKPGLGFPLARLLGILSRSCGAIVEWAVGPCEGKQTGETAVLWRLMDRLLPGDVVVADRYFAGYFGIARLYQLGMDVVIRQHPLRRTDFRRGERLGRRDHKVQWARPPRPVWLDPATYLQMPEFLVMREVRSGDLTLVTTLLDAKEVGKQELIDLYAQRWQIELDFRAIKSVMQMDILRCKTPDMIQKEIAVHFLACNLIRTVMAQAACLACLLPRQLSFKASLQILNAFEENLRHAPRGRLPACQDIVLGSIA